MYQLCGIRLEPIHMIRLHLHTLSPFDYHCVLNSWLQLLPSSEHAESNNQHYGWNSGNDRRCELADEIYMSKTLRTVHF